MEQIFITVIDCLSEALIRTRSLWLVLSFFKVLSFFILCDINYSKSEKKKICIFTLEVGRMSVLSHVCLYE